jgi:transposase
MPKKLKEADVKEIVRLRKAGLLMPVIAKRFKVSASHVGSIFRGKTWKHVTNETGLPPQSGRFTKLKRADVGEVIRLRGEGLSCRAIARHFGDIVTYQQIHKIVTGQSWVA